MVGRNCHLIVSVCVKYVSFFFLHIILMSVYTVTDKPVGWAGMYYDCINDYTVCGPAGHYNKWFES